MNKELNVLDLIEELGLTKKISESFAEKMNMDSSKLKEYIDEKIKNRINIIGKSLNSGDMDPKEFNQLRRLGDVDFSKQNDNIIKDK